MASESRAITVTENSETKELETKEPVKKEPPEEEGEEEEEAKQFAVVRNFQKVYPKNSRQISAISSGIILLMSSGVFLLYSMLELRNAVFLNENNTEMIDFLPITGWFMGAPIGIIISSLLIPYLFKRTIYILTSFILGISGVLIAINAEKVDVVTLGRLLAGIAHGLVYHTVIIHSGEVAIRDIRLLVIRPISIAPTAAMCITMAYLTYFYSSVEYKDLKLYRYLGINAVFYAVIALIAAPIYTIESVPWLLQNGNNETTAFQTWLKLQDTNEASINENSPIKKEFDELKATINEEKRNNDKNIVAKRNLKKITIAIATRFMFLTIYNIGLFAIFSFVHHERTFHPFTIIFVRLLLGLCAVYIEIDKLHADTETYLSTIGLGFTLIVLNIFECLGWWNWFLYILWIFTLVSYSAIPIAGEFQSNVYLSEAFPFSKKTWSVAIVLIFECLAHIGYIVVTLNVPLQFNHYLMIGFGVVLWIFPFVQRQFLSEKKMMTTREQRKEAHQIVPTTVVNA